MQAHTQLVLLILLLFPLCFVTHAQTPGVNTSGFINFNVGSSTLKHKKCQQVTLFGCNTVVVIDSASSKYPYCLGWDMANQVVPGIPYGQQVDIRTGNTYKVSRYYIASPPVFSLGPDGKIEPNTVYDIGLVTPDEFTFDGLKPAQLVYMDYNVLKPMYIEYHPITFDSSFYGIADSIVPFRVECNDFPWLETKTLPGAKGASGIGYLANDSSHSGQLFLPYYYVRDQAGDSVKTYLNCEVTILNDILLHHEVFFKIGNTLHTSINLKDYRNRREKIFFHCRQRSDRPAGCR